MLGWLAITGATQGTNSLTWWQVTTGVLGIPTAIFAILGGYRVSQKTRLETRKLQLEIEKEEGRARQPREVAPAAFVGATSARFVAAGDVLTQFVIYVLLQAAWSFVAYLIYPFVAFVIRTYNLHENSTLDDLGLNYRSLIYEIPSLLIFVLVGLPLLLDIARRAGLSPRHLFRLQPKEARG